MPERLSNNEAESPERLDSDQTTEVVTPGEDDSRRWQESEEVPESSAPGVGTIEVSTGTRELGRYNQRRHRIETTALHTGHITLRHLMPEFRFD